jgi:uncharacterized protein YcgI (DUF1989 family)
MNNLELALGKHGIHSRTIWDFLNLFRHSPEIEEEKKIDLTKERR